MLSCHGCCHTKEHIGCSKGVDCPRVNREVIAAHRKSADLKRKRLVEQSQLTSNPLPAEIYRKCKISDKQRYSSKCRVKEQTQPVILLVLSRTNLAAYICSDLLHEKSDSNAGTFNSGNLVKWNEIAFESECKSEASSTGFESHFEIRNLKSEQMILKTSLETWKCNQNPK